MSQPPNTPAAAPPTVTEIRFIPAPAHLKAQGIRCWANVLIDGHLHIDGLCVRRTERGVYTVTFPVRTNAQGVPHPVVRPRDEVTRAAIVKAVLDAARRGGWIT